MKFQVGVLVLIKKYKSGYRPLLRLRLRPHLHSFRHLDFYCCPQLKNTYGVIIEAINHRDAWEGDSTEDDSVYLWYSQVDAKTYWFCQSDLTQYEVVK